MNELMTEATLAMILAFFIMVVAYIVWVWWPHMRRAKRARRAGEDERVKGVGA